MTSKSYLILKIPHIPLPMWNVNSGKIILEKPAAFMEYAITYYSSGGRMVKQRSIVGVLLVIFTCTCVLTAGDENKKQAGQMRGLYIPNKYAPAIEYMKGLVAKGKPYNINMLVIDVHPYMSRIPNVSKDVVEYLKKERVYCVARIVCFQDGLKRIPLPDAYTQQVLALIDAAADAGFHEVQLDYIRFEDGAFEYSLQQKYDFIGKFLMEARAKTAARSMKLSADIFGRIVYNKNDIIGQQVELFAKYVDVIYPMLYPSHFTDDTKRMSNPGETVREGTLKGLERTMGTNAEVLPYIQAFGYNVGWARVSMEEYVRLQITAIESTSARGWVAWNAKGDYNSVFKALAGDGI